MNAKQLTQDIEALHTTTIIDWKQHNTIHLRSNDFLRCVEENHAFNYQLWHEEDKARKEDMGFEFVYRAKRNIDHYNQQRNNCMEQIDIWLHTHLQPVDPAAFPCPIHSETPGMMIDRLSILSLKQYHMNLQTKRLDVDDEHVQSCQHKLQLIEKQRLQLLNCLQIFIEEIQSKTRTFKVYHQFKMYNDKRLNPELYE